MKQILLIILTGIIFTTVGYLSRELLSLFFNDTQLTSPFISEQKEPPRPLLDYSIAKLRQRTFVPSEIKIESMIKEEDTYSTYVFSYITLQKKMTGQLHIPKVVKVDDAGKPKVIILVRGYVPLHIFTSGVGTKNAAAQFADAGYITVAPDFFGYGGSDPEPTDTWQARFEKPITLIELIKTIETSGVPTSSSQLPTVEVTSNSRLVSNNNALTTIPQPTTNIGVWAHSNGGQISLAALEILSEPIPTTLWAPVTAPFPYSILYFSDEEQDEGKASRKYVSLFEETYDVFDFSLTQHLDLLTGPLQLQHGTADEAAPIIWSDEFIDKIEIENKRRQEFKETLATQSGSIVQATASDLIEPIAVDYHRYPGADHNMQPSWNQAITRDLEFFDKEL